MIPVLLLVGMVSATVLKLLIWKYLRLILYIAGTLGQQLLEYQSVLLTNLLPYIGFRIDSTNQRARKWFRKPALGMIVLVIVFDPFWFGVPSGFTLNSTLTAFPIFVCQSCSTPPSTGILIGFSNIFSMARGNASYIRRTRCKNCRTSGEFVGLHCLYSSITIFSATCTFSSLSVSISLKQRIESSLSWRFTTLSVAGSRNNVSRRAFRNFWRGCSEIKTGSLLLMSFFRIKIFDS